MDQQQEFYGAQQPMGGPQTIVVQESSKSNRGSNTGMIVGIIVAVIICAVGGGLLYHFWDDITKPDQATYIKNITKKDDGLAVINALTSGTGTEEVSTMREVGVCLIMYPEPDFIGWNDLAQGKDPYGSGKTVNMEDFVFMNDFQTEDYGKAGGEMDGSKSVRFARQEGGAKRYFLRSFKVTPGTVLMITTRNALGAPTDTGFLLRGLNCRNIEGLLDTFPELRKGNNGIRWENARDGDEWYINPLNFVNFKKQMRAKFNRCLNLTMGIGGSGGRNDNDRNWKLGLHYRDGTRIIGQKGIQFGGAAPGDPDDLAIGRWIFDYQCNPVIDPSTGKQAYVKSGSGWNMQCPDAMNFCKLDTSNLIGFSDYDKIGLTTNGIPKFIGVEDVEGGISKNARELNDSQIGWTPDMITPLPPDAEAIIAGDAPLPVAVGALEDPPAIGAAPASAATSQFASIGSEYRMNESFVDAGHHNGSINIPQDAYGLKYAAHLF